MLQKCLEYVFREHTGEFFTKSQGRSHKFVSEGDKTGELGTEVPQRVQGQSPGGGLGASAEDHTLITLLANNHCNNSYGMIGVR